MSSEIAWQSSCIHEVTLGSSSISQSPDSGDSMLQYNVGKSIRGGGRQQSPRVRRLARSSSMQNMSVVGSDGGTRASEYLGSDCTSLPSASSQQSYAGMLNNTENYGLNYGMYDQKQLETVGVSIQERSVHRPRQKPRPIIVPQPDNENKVYFDEALETYHQPELTGQGGIYCPTHTRQEGYPSLPLPSQPYDRGAPFSPKKSGGKPGKSVKAHLAYIQQQNSLASPVTPTTPQETEGDQHSYVTRQQHASPSHSSTSQNILSLFRKEQILAEQKCQDPQYRIHPIIKYDVPLLPDDYYLNLQAWEPSPLLAVGFENSIWLLDPPQQQYVNAYDLGKHHVSSVSWASKQILHVGTKEGYVYTIDVEASRIIRTDKTHATRVGVLQHAPLDDHQYASGSHDKTLAIVDTRLKETKGIFAHNETHTGVHTNSGGQGQAFLLKGHQQEVCGQSWCSSRANYLASGGNDNNVGVWDQRGAHYLKRAHNAGIKAVSWKGDTLLTAGGLRDKRVVQWQWGVSNDQDVVADQYTNFSGKHSGRDTIGPVRYVSEVNTKSQISGVVWAGQVPVTAHGFTRNSIMTWSTKPQQMQNIIRMHNKRALFIATDGNTRVATGAGDGTVKVFTVGTDRICTEKSFKQRKCIDVKRSSLDSFLKLR